METLQTTSAGTCCNDKMSGTFVTYFHHPGVWRKRAEGNLVPRVLSYPPSRSVGRVGENPGNEVERRGGEGMEHSAKITSALT